MAIPLPSESDRFEPGSLADWHNWLAEHHADTPGIWLVTPRKRPPGSDLTYEESVREALVEAPALTVALDAVPAARGERP